MIERDEPTAAERGPPCCIPDCTVREDGSNTTCVIWGARRLCYRHFARYYEWSVFLVDRGPTAPEWEQFLASLDSSTQGVAP